MPSIPPQNIFEKPTTPILPPPSFQYHRKFSESALQRIGNDVCRELRTGRQAFDHYAYKRFVQLVEECAPHISTKNAIDSHVEIGWILVEAVLDGSSYSGAETQSVEV